MPKQKQVAERWITAREATAILRKNSGRQDIPDSYIRSLARSGKVETRHADANQGLDGRTNLYRASDVESYEVKQRSKSKQVATLDRVEKVNNE